MSISSMYYDVLFIIYESTHIHPILGWARIVRLILVR